MSSMELAAVDENLYFAEAWLSDLELVNDIDHAALPAILLPYSSSQESARLANTEADTTNLGLRDEQLQMVRESMNSVPHDHNDVAATAPTSDLQMSSVNNVNPPPHRSSFLLDCSTRAMCKKVTLKEAVMYEAIEKLGGGEKGLHLLMDHVRSWIAAAARNCSTTSTTNRFISISDSLQQLCVTVSDQASPPPPPPPPSTSPPLQLAGADHLYITDLAASHMSTSTQNAVSRYSCKAHRKRKRSSIANPTATETNYHTDSSSVYTRSSSYDHSCWNRIVTNPLQLEKRRLAGSNVYHSRSSMSRTSSTAAAATRAARKHRMAYQRQQLIGRSCAGGKQPAAAASNSSSDYAMHQQYQQQPTASAATGLAAPVAKKLLQQPVSSTANKQQYSRNQFFINSRQKQQGLSTGTLVLLLHKLLQPSDVTSLGRIVLPKKEAESCLPYLAVKEGMSLAMEDFDTGKTWKVRYRYWPNNRSRMYLIENTGVFVRSHQLEEGDLLILYRNVERNQIVIQGKKKTQSDGSCIGGAAKDEKLSAAAAANVIATQDSGGLVVPRLDAKLQKMAVKWEQEITKDQASSQLLLHCPVSAVLETTASHKAGDGTQFEDSSDLGDLMQGIFADKKHGSSRGLAPGGQNLQQLLSFPSLKYGDLLMANVSHLPSWDGNSTAVAAAVISKVDSD